MYDVFVIKPTGEIIKTSQAKVPDYDFLKETIGGLIQFVPHFTKFSYENVEYKRGQAVVNEEGILINLPYNGYATTYWLQHLGDGPFSYRPRLFGNMVYYAKQPK